MGNRSVFQFKKNKMILFTDLLVTLIFIGICFVALGLGYYVGNIAMDNRENSYEKISSYECGFEAFSDAREPFDIKFYLIAILFIIFDVEVLFFFPFVCSINIIFIEGFYTMILFMIILMIGFAYEWRKNCMDWE